MNETGRNPAVVSAMRLTDGDHRPSVIWIAPARAGPVMARHDQKIMFTR